MDNMTRPAPGDKSEGCFVCGGGKDQILTGRKGNGGVNIAVCSKCVDLPQSQLPSQPFNLRASA